jgi:hypothetical protein
MQENANRSGQQFRFRKNDAIGAADAEFDDRFLDSCFVDSGDLSALRDCHDPKRIIVGRTGAGKSALLKMLSKVENNVVQIAPENLSLNFLANSEVLRFFEAAGTNLDVFYQLLWRHVLVVELIKYHYGINNDGAQNSFLKSLAQVFTKDKAKQTAIEYLKSWGGSFWNETEYRVKEVTGKIESELRASLEGSLLENKIGASGTQKLSEEERLEVVTRGARVVSQVQIKALSDVLRLLGEEIFTDPLNRHFITIDDLDTRWVDDSLKYKLIRALIETIKTFRQVKNVKVVVSIRLDLLHRVIESTKDSGFQSEKYESLYLSMRWSNSEIMEMIEKRIASLVKQRYTSQSVALSDLFPKKIGKIDFSDYLTQRTFLRPRDAILFINECLERAADRQQVTAQIVTDAEAAYSRKRFLSLQEEWGTVYPKISVCVESLMHRPSKFKYVDLSEGSLNNWLETRLLAGDDSIDPVVKIAEQVYLAGSGEFNQIRIALVSALYVVSAIGIKPDSTTPVLWSYYSSHTPNFSSLTNNSVVHIHPTFWRVLGTKVL